MTKIYVVAGSMISAAGDNFVAHRHLLSTQHSAIRLNASTVPQLIAPIDEAIINDAVSPRRFAHLRRSDPVVRLGVWAARQATAQLSTEQRQDCLVLAGSSRGATQSLERDIAGHYVGKPLAASTSPVTTLGSLAATIATDIGSQALQCSLSAACTTSLHSIGLASKLLQTNTARYALCGGAEFACTPFTLSMLSAAGIYAASNAPYQPFALARSGMVLGDGAAFMVLSTERPAVQDVVTVSGFGAAHEQSFGAHISVTGEALQRAIRQALVAADLRAQDIDVIVTHGAGTEKGDLAELSAYEAVFSSVLPTLGIYKWLSGHLLGAAGAWSSVLAWNLMLRGEHFPPPYETILPQTDLKNPLRTKHVLVSSLGFGGNAAALILSKS